MLQNADAIAELAESYTETLPTLISWGKKFGEFIGLLEKPIDERVEDLQKEIETQGSLGWNQNVLSGRKEELAGLLEEQAEKNKIRKERQDREDARRGAEERSRAAQRTRSVIEGLQLEHDQLGRNSVAGDVPFGVELRERRLRV